MKITTLEMECALARHFNVAKNLIVPGVSWGFDIHECDLLVISPAGYATEVEIKVSRSDLLADKKKDHGHKSLKIKRLYFAIPDTLSKSIPDIPAHAGVVIVATNEDFPWPTCKIVRKPKSMQYARKLTTDEISRVAWLGAMRIFRLKEKIIELKQQQKGGVF